MSEEIAFVDKCISYLKANWDKTRNKIELSGKFEFTDKQTLEVLRNIITSKTKTYHYVLPTQILAKCNNHDLDCRSLQKSFKSKGAFDARTIAHKVIVPFDKQNFNVLGGSDEPYVSNPLRCAGITKEFREQQKNKQDWDLMVDLLQEVEKRNDRLFTESLFLQLLSVIYDQLSYITVTYPTPNRISLEATVTLIKTFILEKSGGERLETITASLFKTIAEVFDLFDKIERSKINASDTSTGLSSDIECWKNGKIIFTIEVKDKELTLTQFESTIEVARANQITEILFVAEKGIDKKAMNEISLKVKQEFISGQNIYVSDFLSFATIIFILFGETGRVKFLSNIGKELDRVNSSISNKRKWAELLKNN